MNASAPIRAVVRKDFAYPAERVYDAWLDPVWLARWMVGSAVRDERIVRLENDPRVGGRFSYVVERAGAEIDHLGEFLELDRPRRLAFTWATRDSLPETSTVTVEISPTADGCRLVLTHEMGAAWADYLDSVAGSWGRMLDALERACAA